MFYTKSSVGAKNQADKDTWQASASTSSSGSNSRSSSSSNSGADDKPVEPRIVTDESGESGDENGDENSDESCYHKGDRQFQP